MSPDSKVIKEGMIRCTEAITRILDTTNCFEDVSATIAVSSVVKCLKPPAIPKGTAKLLAFDKFKGLRNPKPKDTGKKIWQIYSSQIRIRRRRKTHWILIRIS